MTDITNKQQLWQSRIEDCKNSSMPAKQWCQENQIAYSTYSYWVRKLRSETIPEQKFFSEEPVFAQLPSEQDILNASQGIQAPISMFLGRVRIDISSHCPQNLLQSLIELLKRYA